MNFAIVRGNAGRGYGRTLTVPQRGMRIGAIQSQVRSAAGSIGLSIDARAIRIALASEVFEREILTFSQLSDDELIALQTWVRVNQESVSEWLAEKYGGTERLPGI